MKSHWRVFNIHADAPFPAAPVLKIVVVLGGGGGVSFLLPTRVKSRVFIRASNEGNEVSNNTLLTSFVTLRIIIIYYYYSAYSIYMCVIFDYIRRII